jgi:transposase InsO family protein
MGFIDDTDPEIELVLAKYRLIADAIEAPKSERRAILRELSMKEHPIVGGKRGRLSLRTLERWVSRYEKNGIKGLSRTLRSDRGKTRSLLPAILERAITLRKELPSRSTPKLIDILERAGEVAKDSVKRATLDRFLDQKGASRRMMHVLGTKRHVRLSFEHPLDFVVGDFHHGPYVRTETGEICRAKLEAFIDHASRYLPESRYGITEDLMVVRRAMRALCTSTGLPHLIYLDNGSAFQAGRFHFGCSQLGIKIAHSKPYVSEGRGVIERFNRTTKEDFETEVRVRKEPPTLGELNEFWRAWLHERYHRREHSETGEKPLDRWTRLLEKITIRRPDPSLLDEVFRLHARRLVHKKTSTVEIAAVPFVVDTALRNRRVDVLYDPHDLSSVIIFYDGRRIQRALPQVPGERPIEASQPEPTIAPSVDYLALLKRDHERRRAEELSTIRFSPVKNVSSHLTISLLIGQLQKCTGRTLGEVEKNSATSVLEELSPLEIAIAETAFKIAVANLGHGLHATQYLDALRQHVCLARTKGTK